ncbi:MULTISPECIES: SHOCT domain-containing protein [Acidithiobacillaceae]|nr:MULTISPECIES: SHOCT domain-containing protein [Acidithiobacillaceae]
MMIFPFLFFLLCILLVVLFLRGGMGTSCGGFGGHRHATRGEDARAILDSRYARGEISREEWERMRRDLE